MTLTANGNSKSYRLILCNCSSNILINQMKIEKRLRAIHYKNRYFLFSKQTAKDRSQSSFLPSAKFL